MVSRKKSAALVAGALVTAAMTLAAAPADDAQAAYSRGDYAAAARIWEALAQRGDRAAEIELGGLYATGKGVTRDPVKSKAWFRAAAFQGRSAGDITFNIMFVQDTDMIHDAKALVWLQTAAENGNALAQGDLGMMYAAGTGMPRDDTKALFWLRKSADQGNALGELTLGGSYENGQGVKPDYAQALGWYDKAANQGLGVARNARMLLLAHHPELRR